MLKMLLFSDYHYWKTHYPQGTDGFDQIVARARAAKVDLIVHCGDLCHNAPDAPELKEHLFKNQVGIPVWGCLGNHEVEDAASVEEVLRVYGLPGNYYYQDVKGYRLIFLDTNYFPENGELVHNKPFTHSAPNGDKLTAEQLEWLRKTVADAPGRCVLFSHASLERPCGCAQSDDVREILRQHHGKVVLCCNGHMHTDSIAESDGAVWFDVNAVYNILWHPMDNPFYSDAFKATARMTRNCCFASEPLSAIVTLDGDQVTIEGMRSHWLYGVSAEMVGCDKPNRFGRRPCPIISSRPAVH